MEERLKNWPVGSDGRPETAAFLGTEGDFAAYAGIVCSLLESCGIPYLTRRSAMQQLGAVYGGFSPVGIDIYVPASCLEQAKMVLKQAADSAANEDKEEEE